jgi:hypothetical protein
MAAQQLNQQAALQGSQQRLQAAGQLGALAGQGQQSYLQGAMGAIQGQTLDQQQRQAQLDAARQYYTEQQQFPLQQLQIPLTALGMTPYGQTTTTTQSLPPSNGLMQGLGAASAGVGILGSLFSPAGGGGMLSGMLPALGLSDKNMKEDVTKVGKDKETGLDLYAYRYKGDPKTYPKVVGPMAQDVAEKYPDQVSRVGNRLAVNLGFGPMKKASAR